MPSTTQTFYDPRKRIVSTAISGDADPQTIQDWQNSFSTTLEQIPDNTAFRVFINLHGFKALDLDAHKQFRKIIPLTLARYGWKVGYIDLFPEQANEIAITSARGVRCVAAAHVHHDQTKMDLYETKFSRTNEHFFVDPVAARSWLEVFAV
jgi:hypothetical protein